VPAAPHDGTLCENVAVTSQTDDGVLFLLGAARSGTSLLYKALCLHPDAAYFNNWMRRMPHHPAVTMANRVARRAPTRRRRVWFNEGDNAYVYSQRRSVGERLFPMPVEGEPVFADCGVAEYGETAGDDATAEQVRALRRAVGGALRWGGGRCFINKRIANNRRIALLAQAFPRARFVDITRDGRAVALSLSRVDWWENSVVWWYGDTPKAWRESGRDPWALCARNWVEEVRAIDAGIARLDTARVLRLSYEDFTSEPVARLRDIAAFAGLRDDEGWFEQLAQFNFTNRNTPPRTNLTPEVAATIDSIQTGELSRHGYH
jgi:Sulfotransferase family